MINKRTQIRRLNRLFETAKSTPSKEFDMTLWWKENGCKTKGCLAGHYMHQHRVKDSRLVECFGQMVNASDNMAFDFIDLSENIVDALIQHFGLNYETVQNLFYPRENLRGRGGREAKMAAVRKIKNILGELQ